ncbi:histone-fold-containing protein [Ramicandelaber brevisporus]|nr:histone-fold-containing protein [Ramicandelaber brevisporus]
MAKADPHTTTTAATTATASVVENEMMDIDAPGPAIERDEDTNDATLQGIDEFKLPEASIKRVLKASLTASGSGNLIVQQDARDAFLTATTVFISYLTSAASDNAKHIGQKTVSANHVLDALEALEFGEFVPQLKADLAAKQSLMQSKRAAAKSNTTTTTKAAESASEETSASTTAATTAAAKSTTKSTITTTTTV